MTNAIAAAALILLGYPAAASEPVTRAHNVGIGAGYVTGYGISYRHWFRNGFGYQVNFAPYYRKTDCSEERNLSLGVTGLKVIHGAETVNLIGYAGASILHEYDRYSYACQYGYEEMETKNTTYTFGGGPGFDVRFWHLSLNAMFGVRVSTDSNHEVRMDITGETAIYYSFD